MKNKYLFYLPAIFLSFSFLCIVSNAQAANPDCYGGYCVDTEVICGVHGVTIQDYISPGLIGAENVSCYEINGNTQSGAYNYSWSNLPGEEWVFNSIRCSGSGPLAGISIYDSSSCQVKTGSINASIEGPSQVSSNDSGVKFIFEAAFDDLSLDSGAGLEYNFSGGGLASTTEGSATGSKTEVKGVGGCPSSPTACEYRGNKYRGNTCCRYNECYEPVCYQSGTQYYCFDYITRQYDEMGSCFLTCNTNYILTSTATGIYDSDTFSMGVYYTCPVPPTPPSSDVCGTASGNTYLATEGSWAQVGNPTFCTSGSPLGGDPLFPDPGKNVFWDCQDKRGCSASRDALPSPTLEFTANQYLISYNTASTLKWTSTNVTSCTASGRWTGSKALGGPHYQSTGNLIKTGKNIYNLSCTGPGGSISKFVTITVALPIFGKCGSAAKTYDCNTTNYQGSPCDPGTSIPAPIPSFPSPGETVTWRCLHDTFYATPDCTATRKVCGQSDWIEVQ